LLGTFVNAIAIIIGTLLGASLGAKLQQRYVKIIMRLLGVITLILGVQMLAGFSSIVVPILSLLNGGAMGYSLHIDKAVTNFVSKFSKNGQGGRGFVAASVLFCVGPMSIVGSLEDGLHSNPSILLTKAGLDGVSSVVLSATFGIGVMLSALLVFALQGSITLASSQASSFLTQQLMSNLTTTGGSLVLVIAANLLGFDKFKVENLLPSLLIVTILSFLSLP
jgi:uncharacterized membrane protein YqgA involved in biofilm formation